MPDPWVIFFAVSATLAIATAAVRFFRRRKYATVMAGLGFHPVTKDDDLFRELLQFRYLKKGKSPPSYSSFHRTSLENMEVLVFDFGYDRTGTGEENLVRQTVIGFKAPDLALPFMVRGGTAGLSYQCRGNLIFFYVEGQLVAPEKCQEFMTRCLKLLEKIRRDPPPPARSATGQDDRAEQKRADGTDR